MTGENVAAKIEPSSGQPCYISLKPEESLKNTHPKMGAPGVKF